MNSLMLRTMRLVIVMSLLSACASGVSSSVCPPPRNYDDAFNTKLADEVAALPADTAVVLALIDYATLRDQLRACQPAR